jgi:hypothetical protein
MPDQHDHDLRLNQFWNELTDHGDSSTPIDPQTAAVIRRLHVSANAPLPGSARERVWRGLLDTYEQTVPDREPPMLASTDVIRPGPNVNGRAALVRPTPLVEQPQQTSRRRLLFAAALVLALIGGIVASVIRTRPADEPPIFLPAAVASPESSTSPAAGEHEILFRTNLFPDRDSTDIHLDFFRGAIAPGREVTSPEDYAGHPGFEIELVLAGSLVVHSDSPFEVIRAGAEDAPETVVAGIDASLDAGDAAIFQFESARTYRNPGEGWVELLGALVVVEPVDPAGQWVGENFLVRTGNHFGTVPATDLGTGPLTLTLGRIIGDASAANPARQAHAGGGIEWRSLDFSDAATPTAADQSAVVYVLTLE